MEERFDFKVCIKYEEKTDHKVPAIAEHLFVIGDVENPEYWDTIYDCKNKTIGYVYEAFVSNWNVDQFAEITEHLADKMEKFIIVVIEKNQKKVIVPSKHGTLYAKPRIENKLSNYHSIPYTGDNMKACSMTKSYAEGTLRNLKSGANKKGRKYVIESLNQITLF